MIIKLYIYNKETGLFIYDDVGNPESVTNDLAEHTDFTLIPLPDRHNLWYWINNKWQLKEEGETEVST